MVASSSGFSSKVAGRSVPTVSSVNIFVGFSQGTTCDFTIECSSADFFPMGVDPASTVGLGGLYFLQWV